MVHFDIKKRLRAFLLLWLFILSGCTQVANLQTNLDDTDANEIIALLSRQGIAVKKQASKEGVTLTVDAAELARATDIMRAAGLPKRHLSNLGQVFKKDGMISTPLEERIRYIHGLSQELEYTLQNFDNVISARVHVVLPERIAPGEPVQPSSAAVFIKYREPFDIDTNMPRIRNLVASSIPGLSGSSDSSKVSVVFAPAAAAPKPVIWENVGPFKVEESSGSALRWTLFGAVALALGGLIIVGWAATKKLKNFRKS
jgi:type III secretion protein J